MALPYFITIFELLSKNCIFVVMKKLMLLLVVVSFASCKQMKRCECETPAGVTPYEFSTEIYYETPSNAEQLCAEREVGKEWECHIAN